MTKKIIAGAAVVAAAFLYVVFSERQSGSGSVAPPVASMVPAQPAAGSAEPSSSVVPGAGALHDGTYTGPVADAVYGELQVAAVVAGGKLTAVNVLQEPDAPGHTMQVNAAAVPQLVSEAIAAQSAEVDVVSGATQTSEAFQQSLGAALAQAQS